MNTCPKCSSQIDDDMVLCPTCGEHLRTFSDKNKNVKYSFWLIRLLIAVSIILPPVGAIMGIVIKKRHNSLGKLCFKNSLLGFAIYCMITLLALICYLAMAFTGISYL